MDADLAGLLSWPELVIYLFLWWYFYTLTRTDFSVCAGNMSVWVSGGRSILLQLCSCSHRGAELLVIDLPILKVNVFVEIISNNGRNGQSFDPNVGSYHFRRK